MADLFGVKKAAISKHVKNIYACGELEENATVSKMETVQIFAGTDPANPNKNRGFLLPSRFSG